MLIILPGGLGDTIILTAAIRELARKRPGEKLLVTSPFPEVFENSPRIEKHLPFGSAEDEMHRCHQRGEPVLLLQPPVPYPNAIQGTMAQFFGKQLGIRVSSSDPEIFLRDEELAPYPRRNNVVVIDTWAKWPNRRWSFDNFKKLVDLLHQRGMVVVEAGRGVGDCLGNSRYLRLPNSDESLIDKQSIREAAALLASSRLAIGNSGGFVDIAAAASTPQVVLYSGVAAWWIRGYSTTYPVCCMTKCTKCHGIQYGNFNTHGDEGRCYNDAFCLDAEIAPEDVMEMCERNGLIGP